MNAPAPAIPAPPEPRIVRVELEAKSYDVVIGRDLLSKLEKLLIAAGLTPPGMVIYDETLAKESIALQHALGPLYAIPVNDSGNAVPSGEKSKSALLQAERLLRLLAQHRIARSGTLIALGGGVIGDLAGFVAAIYLRGIDFVQIPTTLLAMVDSSVGGKTGVNLPEGKNLVGAFHQPKLVVADLDTLATLPPREFSAGMAEVIKYGAIKDRALFDRVARGVKAEDSDLADIVTRCVEIKARIVEQDEFETTGLRALLNFGHTLGHAIEKVGGYQRYLHGEAISIGMRAAAWLSVWRQGLPEAEAGQIEDALLAHGLPVQLGSEFSNEAIFHALGNDKKVASDGQNRWVLLDEIGRAESGIEIEPDLVRKAIELLKTAP